MENYIKKAADAFLVERPYGMRVDYRKKGFVLFNRNLNVLGNAEHARLEELPLERFNVEEIPLEAEERRVQEEQHQWLLNEQKRKFLDGERITGEMFLEITGRDGFDIHIRTKGTFNRHVRGIDRNGTVSFRKIKGCRTPDFTGCHKAVSAYLAFITEKEGK